MWANEFRAKQAERDEPRTFEDIDPGRASFEMPGDARRDQVGNFMDAIRDGARLACDVDLGCSTMVAIKMGVEAYRQNAVMLWDPATERMGTS